MNIRRNLSLHRKERWCTLKKNLEYVRVLMIKEKSKVSIKRVTKDNRITRALWIGHASSRGYEWESSLQQSRIQIFSPALSLSFSLFLFLPASISIMPGCQQRRPGYTKQIQRRDIVVVVDDDQNDHDDDVRSSTCIASSLSYEERLSVTCCSILEFVWV